MKRLIAACLLVGLLDVGVSAVKSKLRGQAQRNGRRRLQQDITGVYLQGQVMIDESGRRLQQEAFVRDGSQPKMRARTIDAIELEDGSIYELTGLTDDVASSSPAIAEIAGLPFDVAPDNAKEILSVKFNSGETLIRIPAGSYMDESAIDLTGQTPGAVDSIIVDEANGGGVSWAGFFGRDLQEKQGVQIPHANNDQRRLKTGERSVLVVRVLAADATTGYSESLLSNSVFGNEVDAINLRDQYLKCSHNQLTFNPVTRSGVNNGVVTVDIRPETVTGREDSTIRNLVNTKLAEMFGVSNAKQLANHVVHCMPPGTSGDWIGYAFINSWNSVFNNEWCTYSSIQMHEVGHNLNLAHSGTQLSSGTTNEYDDQSGLMGYSYSESDTRMCFNNAKNYQLGWFTDAVATVTKNNIISVSLKGQVNYQPGVSNQDPVIIRIDVSESTENYYVGFNHKSSYNSDTNEYANKVTIHRYQGTGYALSFVEASLGSGQSWNNGRSGEDRIEVKVISLSTSTSSGRAEVTVVYGGCSSDFECDDNISCNGVETCSSSGVCVQGTLQPGCCGNGLCETASESYSSCAADCASKDISFFQVSNA